MKIGRRCEKRWGVLFTCLSMRAIHLELAHSLTASSAIMAVQQLSARRGAPIVMYSDNGTNFRGACKELKDDFVKMETNKQHLYTLKNGMKLIFLPSGRKASTSRPLRETKLPLFGAVEQKNSILTLASKKEILRSHVCQPRLRLGRQLHVI